MHSMKHPTDGHPIESDLPRRGAISPNAHSNTTSQIHLYGAL